VIKAPVWRWYIPAYFFAGGLSAGSALIGFLGRRTRRPLLARRAWVTAAGSMAIGGGLLVADLGRPERFANMLRMAKPTSPMSVGSWVIAVYGPAAGVAAACDVLGVVPGAGIAAEAVAAVLAPVVASYTAVLIGDTSVPAWHGARAALPLVFVSGAAVSAGGVACAVVPLSESAPARRLAVGAVVGDLLAHRMVDAALGPTVARAHHDGRAGRLRGVGEGLLAGGALLLTVGGRRWRGASVVGGLLVVAGAVTDRFAILAAGVASAEDPSYTVGPQRAGLGVPSPK
jgi:hypothetical protein